MLYLKQDENNPFGMSVISIIQVAEPREPLDFFGDTPRINDPPYCLRNHDTPYASMIKRGIANHKCASS